MYSFDKRNNKLIATANKKFDDIFDKTEFLFRKKADAYIIGEFLNKFFRLTENDYIQKSMEYSEKVKSLCDEQKTFHAKIEIYNYFVHFISPIAKTNILNACLTNVDDLALKDSDRLEYNKYKAYCDGFKKIDGMIDSSTSLCGLATEIKQELQKLRSVFGDDFNDVRLYFTCKDMELSKKREDDTAKKDFEFELKKLSANEQYNFNRCNSYINKLLFFYKKGFKYNDDIVNTFVMYQFANTYIDENPELDNALVVILDLIEKALSIAEVKKIIDFFSPIFGYKRNCILFKHGEQTCKKFNPSPSNEKTTIKYGEVSRAIDKLIAIPTKIERMAFYNANKNLLKDFEDEILLKIDEIQK